jgi:hypothetical protein
VTVSIAALSGCAASTTPEPAPVPTPSLTQEQQDDAAFQDVFTRYTSMDPADETEATLSPLLTGDALSGEISAVETSKQKGQREEGLATTSAFEITGRGVDTQGTKYMVAQACLDVSGTRTVDQAGNDVTPQRDNRLSLQMKAIQFADGSWRISDSVRNEKVRACD